MKRKKNPQQIEFLSYLSQLDKTEMLNDLLLLIEKAKKTNDWSIVVKCVEDWEDTAELNSIPGLKNGCWEKFNELQQRGIIT